MPYHRNVISYIAMSLDGFIAGPDDDISFLSMVEKEGEDYGYADFMKTVDTIFLGRRTYDKVRETGFEYPREKEIYIISHSTGFGDKALKYYSGPLKSLISDLRKREGKDIFCDGGSEVLNQLLQDDLIDEFYISIIPVILGDGIRLFKDGYPALDLQLVSAKQFDTGLVQLHYIKAESRP
jgi:dihydrofolate reductase